MSNKTEKERVAPDKLKRSLLEAAISIARSEGWEAVSTRKIASRIDYSTTAIYHYFGSKEGIFSTIREVGFRTLLHYLEREADPFEGESLRQLALVSSAYYRFGIEQQTLYELMFGLGIRQEQEQDGLLEDFRQAVFPYLSACGSGHLWEHWWSLLHGFVARRYLVVGEDKKKELDEAFVASLEHFFHLVDD